MKQCTYSPKCGLGKRKRLTTYNVNDVNDVNGRWPALMHSAYDGHITCVALCLAMGANPNVHVHYGSTALHLASCYENIEIIHMLVDGGALIDAIDNDMCTPLYWSIYQNHPEVTRALIDRGAMIGNVNMTKCVVAIPKWITEFIALRDNYRRTALLIMGIHKYRKPNVVIGGNGMDVMRLIGKHIWSSRFD